jgi:hypothetical protein
MSATCFQRPARKDGPTTRDILNLSLLEGIFYKGISKIHSLFSWI